MDPARRLSRPVPGARLAREGRGIARLFAREDAEARPDPVPARDQRTSRVLTSRETTRVAGCRPNAPLLIRIVRYPFALETGRAARRKYRDEAVTFERVDWSAAVASALAERSRLRFTSAGRKRPLPFAVRPSSWILLPPDPGDER